jgi:malonyl-CoA/methylmalonyl-CoA synthetase
MGAVSVPLSVKATTTEIEYYLHDSKADLVVTENHFMPKLTAMSTNKVPIIVLDDLASTKTLTINTEFQLAENRPKDDCLIIYTSGTTGKPKGVMHTHASHESQIKILSDYWGWSEHDKILNVLPMHHVHGLVNIMNCALWNGATSE